MTNAIYLSPEARDQVLRALDMGEWKHSWHLPKDQYGNKIITMEVVEKLNEMVLFRLNQIDLLLNARALLTDLVNPDIQDLLKGLLKCSMIPLANVELVVSGTEIVGVRVRAPTR